MRVVIDIDVMVSAVLSPRGTSARVLDILLDGELIILFDDRIMDEYRAVLSRKKFGFDPDGIDDLLNYFLSTGERIVPRMTKFKMADADDMPFLETAVSGVADALMTGNKRHFPKKVSGLKILSPDEFLKIF